MARDPGFDLVKALASPSFTPAQRDASALVELVVGGADPAAERAAEALAGLGETGRRAIEGRLTASAKLPGVDVDVDVAELSDAATARLVSALGLLARRGDATARRHVIERTRDPHVRVRRAAILAAGKLGDPKADDARAALLARWDAGDAPPDERRALVEALGKLGGDGVADRLRAIAPGDDKELARRRDRALLMLDRTARRDVESTIAVDVPPPAALSVVLRCKPGLAPLLAEELAQLGLAPHPRGDSAVAITLAAPLATLQRSRLWASAAIEIPIARDGELGDRIIAALAAAPVRALLAAWTRGPIRWRLGFAHGHKRAVVWRVAKEVTARAPELVNDPTQTTWDVVLDAGERALELVPRRAADTRFAWRVAEVPAASHPTVAAGLAFVAGTHATDRVWDPFVGAAAELVERARLGAYRSLAGSDLDDRALAAARANLDAAGLGGVQLERGDARAFDPGEVDLVITNPPLGSRVQVDAAALLVDALPHLTSRLAPGGRLVWITPATRKTSPVAERLGLRRSRALPVDLGGVRGTLERWERDGR